MTFDDYQTKSRATALYHNKGIDLIYPTLGLVGEAGEVAEKMKKVLRDDNGHFSDDKRAEIQKELGDVLWYVSQLATELDLSLADVAQGNLDKLASRHQRGQISGSGDNR